MYRYIRFTIRLLSILNLVGCSSTTDKLSTAEKLMETAPDSALSILQKVNPDYLTGQSNKALYALLMTQAMEKNDIKLESDSLIRIATEYYNQNDDLIGNSNQFPSYNDLLVRYSDCNSKNYWDFLNAFATDPTKPEYNSPVISTLAPAAFNYVSSSISSNPCY